MHRKRSLLITKNPKACREILEKADDAEKSPEGDPGSGNGSDEPTTPTPADPEDEEEEESRMSQGTRQALHKSKIQFQHLRNKKKGLYIRTVYPHPELASPSQ